MSGPRTTHHFTLRKSHQDSYITLVHPIGQPPTSPPLWSFKKSSTKGTMYRGDPSTSNQIGERRVSSLGGKSKISLRDHQFTIRNSMNSNHTVESSKYGHLKWKGGSRPVIISLEDDSGITIAEFKEAGDGDRQLDILVPCDGFFAEMVVLTALSATMLERGDKPKNSWILSTLVKLVAE